jgi:lysophospholipase L1-like esterase
LPTELYEQAKDKAGQGLPAGQNLAGVAVATSVPTAGAQQLESAARITGAKTEKRRGWLNIALSCFFFVPVAVLTLEAVFGLAGIGQSELVKPDLLLGSRHIPDKLVTWHLEGYSRGRLSSAGLRDVEHTFAKPQGTKRLVFLGDSYTEGLQVSQDDIFARRLQTMLNHGGKGPYESLNFGCSGYSTGQELLQFRQEAAQYKPDLVVLLYTPGDTLENSVSPTKRAEADPRPYFYLDQNGQLRQDNGVLTLNYEKLRPRPLREFLRSHSTIYGAYKQTDLSLRMSDKVYFRTTRLLSQIGAKLAKLTSQTAGDQPPAPGLLPPSWVEPDKLAVSEALIKKLDENVRAAGGKLIVMAYPDVGKGDPRYISAREHLAKLAQQQGFGYLDLSDAFSHDQNPNNLFVKVHFSKLGHDLTARELTAYLKKAGFVPN